MVVLGALLAGYAFALFCVAVLLRRRLGPQSPRAFFVADGRLSALLTAASLVATSVGGTSTVVTAALVYKHGLAGIWLDLAGCLGLLLLATGLAQRVRATGASSIAELVGRFYGEAARKASALVVVLAEVGWLALLAKATAAILAPAVPQLASWQLAAMMLAAVLVYTALGGQLAVAMTDVLQLLLMVLGLLVVAPFHVHTALSVRGASLPLTLTFPTSATLGWHDIGAFMLLMGLPHLVGSDIYAKLLSARDGRTAAWGAFGAALIKLMFALGVGYLGLAAGRLLPLGSPADEALGALIQQVLPLASQPWVLLALVATTMSSADQVLLSAITMSLHDLLPAMGPRRWAKEAAALFFALCAFALAAALPSVVDAMQVGYTVFVSGVALPLLVALLGVRRARPGLTAVAMLGGAALGGGLHVARLLGHFAGKPVIWGLVLCTLLLTTALLLRPREGKRSI